ncbi:MAG: hypothetical protein AABW67_00135 [Nanoarchaeota archaeon]
MNRKEIWIDIRQDKREIKYTLLHEYIEAKLLLKWDKYYIQSYNNAHDYSLAAEKSARRKDGAVYLKD